MNSHLDQVFGSLADGTRRDILRRLTSRELSVTEIAEPYDMSLAAVSKHLRVLERAKLLERKRQGKWHMLSTNPEPLKEAAQWISFYRKYWDEAFDKLDDYLDELQTGEEKHE